MHDTLASAPFRCDDGTRYVQPRPGECLVGLSLAATPRHLGGMFRLGVDLM